MNGKPQQLIPNYTIQEAIKMLPYVQCYCRDIKRIDINVRKYCRLGKRLSSMIGVNLERQEKILWLLDLLNFKLHCAKDRVLEWFHELDKMHLIICSASEGAIDIPVYIEDLDNVIYLCINPNTTMETLEWHSVDENCEKSRAFKWIPIETD